MNCLGARLSKAPETFRARKAIFNSSGSKNGEVYTPETSCMKRASVHLRLKASETFRARKSIFNSFVSKYP